MKKRVFAIALILVLLLSVLPFPASAEKSAQEIITQIRNTYQACLRNAGISSFNGLCGSYVARQIEALGITTTCVGGDGKDQYNNHASLSTTSGGYPVAAYPASSYSLLAALNAITANGTRNAYNMMVGFEKGSNSSNGLTYGHSMFIHAIIDGTVYFSESFGTSAGTGTYHSEGDPISLSISSFCSWYTGWTVQYEGVIHFGKGADSESTLDIEPGIYTIHSAYNWNRVLDIEGASTENRANIQLNEYSDSETQKFRIVKEGDYYCIQSVYSGMWLDVAWPVTETRSNVQLYYTNENDEEKWAFEDADNGYVYIRNYYNNYVDLSNDSSEIGTNVQVYHAKVNDFQRWRLIPVEEPVEVKEGVYTIHSAWDWNKVIDIQNNDTASGANIQLYDYVLNDDVQKFRVVKDGDYYHIQSVYSGMWLDVASPRTESHSNVQLYHLNTLPEDKWLFEDAGNGYVYIRNYYGNYVDIAADSVTNHANIQVYHAKENNSQRWRLIAEPEPVEVPEGVYTIHSAYDNNYVLDIAGDSMENKANIQLYQFLDNDVQKFRVVKYGSYYNIQSVYSELWLDVQYPSTESHANVQLSNNNTWPDEWWQFEDAGNGYVYIRNYYGNYLDIQGSSYGNNTNIQVYHGTNGNSMRWRLRPLAYKIAINGNGGSASTSALQVKYGDKCNLSPSFVSKDGYTLKGWNLYRPSDNKWFAAGIGWRTEEEIADNGYTKDLYAPDLSMTLEEFWLNKADTYFIDSFTFYAVWEETACPHNYITDVIAPTCTTQGYTIYTCSICGDSYMDDYISAVGHNFENGVCSVCGFIEPVIFVDNTNANPGEIVTIPVSIENNCGIAGFTFELSCDAGIIITNVAAGDMLKASTNHVFEYNDEDGIVMWLGQNTAEDGVLLSIEAYVPEDNTGGSFGIHLALRDNKSSYFCDADGNSVPVIISDGTISVEPPHVHTYVDVVTEPTCTEKGYTTHTCSSCGESYVDSSVEALGHNWDAGVVDPAPTCTEDGVNTFTCQRCGATRTEVKTATGHTPSEPSKENEVAASCTEIGGYDLVTRCTACNAVISSEHVTVPASGHDYQVIVTAPTCTERGYTTHTCSICGDSYVDTYVSTLGHSFGSWIQTKAPTCTEKGSEKRTCSRCGKVETRSINALGHDLIHHAAQAPTCTAIGWDAYDTCSRCDYTTYVERAALGHDLIADMEVPATCTTPGTYAGSHCSRCDYKTGGGVIAALGHDLIHHDAKAPTCTEIGWDAYDTCSRCDYTNYNEKAVLGHDLIHHDAKAPTCTTIGWDAYDACSRCDYSTYVEKAALGHNYQSVVTNPTCTEQGYTTHTCSRCGDSYIDSYVDALGHDWDVGVVTIQPTETEKGERTFTCSRCGATKTEAIPELPHTHSYTDVVTPPTCTEKGYTTHTCTCGDSYVDTYVGALGHDWDAGVITVQPAESEKGEKTFTCTRCGETKTETIPELSHVHSYTDVVTPPTCTEKGYTTHTCSCGDSYVDAYVGALGHNWDAGVITVQPTETKDGVKTFTCTRCGATRTETIPATGEGKPCDGGPTCPSYKFTDVKAGDWFHEAVDFAVKNGLFNGMSETTFEPNTPMTRGMLVTVLWRYEGQPEGGVNQFADVKDGVWYAKAVAWAAENGIVTGVGNNKFDPNGKITREQMAAILFRYSDYKGYDVSRRDDFDGFPDKAKVSSWAKDAYGWAVAEKLITGNDGRLDPQGNATRAQVATILMRFIQNIAHTE